MRFLEHIIIYIIMSDLAEYCQILIKMFHVEHFSSKILEIFEIERMELIHRQPHRLHNL